MRVHGEFVVLGMPGRCSAVFHEKAEAERYARRYDGRVFQRVLDAWLDPGEVLPRMGKWRLEALERR